MPLDLVEDGQAPAPYRAPGLDAPLKPSKSQEAAIAALQASTIRRLQGIEASDLAALSSIMDEAQAELARDLRSWIERAADGEYRWSAQRYRNAIAALDDLAGELGGELRDRMTASTEAILGGSIRDVKRDLARFSEVFPGAQQAIASREAAALASGRSFVIPRIKTSAARYEGQVRADIQRRLAIDILKGAPLRDTVDRLVAHGGPTGLVALRGIVGEPGAVVERIPEGLFARYRFWADRVVRTEYAAAHNFTTTAAHREIEAEAGVKLRRQWVTAPAPCPQVCDPLDGVVVQVGAPWQSSIGPVDTPPAHPYCRCTTAIDSVQPVRRKRAAPPEATAGKAAGFPWKAEALKPIDLRLGGMHHKDYFEAPDGSRWMFKPQPEFRALADKAAADVAAALGVPTAEVHVVTLGGKTGSIQRLFDKVAGDLDGVPFESLAASEVHALQREHALDWLLSQHDTHRANVLRLDGGALVGVDKGQAFRFFGSDRFDLSYGAANQPNRTPTVYHDLFAHYAAGGQVAIGGDVGSGTPLGDFLKRAAAMPDADFRRMLEPYARALEAEAKKGQPWAKGAWAGRMTADRFLDLVVERKRGLSDEVGRFYRDLDAKRDKATANNPDVAARKRWAERLAKLEPAGHRGVAFSLGAGADVENAAGLLYHMEGDGTVAELRLRAEGWAKIAESLARIPGGQGATVTETAKPATRPGEKFAEDHWSATVLPLVKSFNHHLGPNGSGAMPAGKLALLTDVAAELKQAVAAAVGSKSATVKAEAAAAEHLLGILGALHPTHGQGGDWNKAALGQKFDNWKAPAKKTGKAPAAPTGNPLAGWSASRVESSQIHQRELRQGKIAAVGGSSGSVLGDSKGAWRIQSPEGVVVYVHGHDKDTAWAVRGRLRIALDESPKTITPAAVERALGALGKLGIETREATEDELAALHLRKYAYRLRLEDTARAEVPAKLPAAEQRAKLAGLLKRESRTLIGHEVDFGAAHLGPDTERGDGLGWHRFHDEAGLLTRWQDFDDFRLHHNLYNGLDDLARLLETGGAGASLASTMERNRLGLARATGMSSETDTKTGGASYVFTRVRTVEGARQDPGLVFRARSLFSDLDTWSQPGDTFGNTGGPGPGAGEYARRWKPIRRDTLAELADQGRNETLVKHSINLAEHLDVVVVRNQAERKRAIEILKRAGLAVVGNRKPEEIVVIAK